MSDGADKTVLALADTEQVAVTWSRYAVGTRGPGPHIHRHHADAFYVLDGSLRFGVGPAVANAVEAAAGSLVLVPAGVVHTFANEGPGEARFLNVHAPGVGFVDYLRAMRDGREEEAQRFDTHEPPADGGRSPSDVVVRGPREGDAIAVGANHIAFKAEVDDGDGTFSLTEQSVAPGFPGPPPHHHDALVDSFYVLDGTLTIELEEAAVDAGPGTFALVPPGTVHSFSNAGTVPVRLLNLLAPGGFEQSLKEVAAEAGGRPVDPERLAAIASRYDFRPAVQPY